MLDDAQLELLSLDMEVETGYDSISTIEDMYGCECPFPGCSVHRRDPVAMWKHVHFGRKHGLSFGCTLDALIEQRRDRIGEHA